MCAQFYGFVRKRYTQFNGTRLLMLLLLVLLLVLETISAEQCPMLVYVLVQFSHSNFLSFCIYSKCEACCLCKMF